MIIDKKSSKYKAMKIYKFEVKQWRMRHQNIKQNTLENLIEIPLKWFFILYTDNKVRKPPSDIAAFI